MKSSLINMVLVLFAITLVASAGVGGVYIVTKEPIETASAQKKLNALSTVLPEFDNDPSTEVTMIDLAGGKVPVYRAAKGGETIGYAVETEASGFADKISVMTGFDISGKIVNIEVLKQAETPGLGAKLTNPENPVTRSLVGRKPAEITMSVRKDGGDVDAITASTISSRAYVSAVNMAYAAFMAVADPDNAPDADSFTGATSQAAAGQTDTETGATSHMDVSGGAEPADSETGATVQATEDTDAATGATVQTQNKEDSNE